MPFLLFILFIVIAVTVHVIKAFVKNVSSGREPLLKKLFSAASRNEEWMKAAGTLKLAYSRPSSPFENPSLSGSAAGFEVDVDVVERSGISYTVYAVDFPEPLDMDFYFSSRELLEKVESFIDSETPVEKILSKLKSFSEANPTVAEKVSGFLKRHGKAPFLNILRQRSDLMVTEDGIMLEIEGVDEASLTICSRVDSLLRTAKAIYVLASNDSSVDMKYEGSAEGRHEMPVPEMKAPAIAKPQPEIKPHPPIQSKPPIMAEPEFKPQSILKPVSAPVAPNKTETPPVSRLTDSAPASSSLTSEGLGTLLFSATLAGQREKDEFEKVKGGIVSWSGKLVSAYQYSMDFTFGSNPGTKAVFELCEITGAYSMKSKVKGVVQFSPEAFGTFKNATGQTFQFKGSLAKFEPFAKEIYIASASLLR